MEALVRSLAEEAVPDEIDSNAVLIGRQRSPGPGRGIRNHLDFAAGPAEIGDRLAVFDLTRLVRIS